MATAAKQATQAQSGPVGASRGANVRKTVAYALLIAYALLMFIPFFWSVSTSFKTLPESLQMTWIPESPTVDAYVTAWTRLNPPLPRIFMNSILIAGAVTLSNLVLGSIAGYAFARLRFPGRELIFITVLATLMIPDQLRVLHVYTLLVNFGLIGRGPGAYVGIILVLAISATSIFLLRQYFLSIPRDLEEAARIDGAGYFQTFWRIILPLASPALAAVAILQFQGTWNGFFWPLVLLRDRSQWTLPLALGQFRFEYQTQWPPLMALVVLATIPIVVLYLFFQRYFVEGIAASGVKG